MPKNQETTQNLDSVILQLQYIRGQLYFCCCIGCFQSDYGKNSESNLLPAQSIIR